MYMYASDTGHIFQDFEKICYINSEIILKFLIEKGDINIYIRLYILRMQLLKCLNTYFLNNSNFWRKNKICNVLSQYVNQL